MDPSAIRKSILTKLYQKYQSSSHVLVPKPELTKTISVSGEDVKLAIKYLEQKNLVRVLWLRGGQFSASITREGIDALHSLKDKKIL